MKTTSATLQNGKCTSQQQSESRTMFSMQSMSGFRFAIHGANHLKQNENCMFKKETRCSNAVVQYESFSDVG